MNHALQGHPRQIIVKSSDKMVHWRREWQTTSVFLPWEPNEQYKRQKDRILKGELPRLAGVQYATGEEWRNNSRKNEETEPKQKQRLGVDVTGDGSKVWRCTDQYYIGSWNVRSMNKSKLEVVKQEMARVKPTLGDLFKERTFLGMSLFRMGGWYTNFFFIKRRTVVEAVVGIDSRHDGVHGRCILTSVWGNSVYGSQRSP